MGIKRCIKEIKSSLHGWSIEHMEIRVVGKRGDKAREKHRGHIMNDVLFLSSSLGNV